jgi:23S rRNA pseudouridine955/2504/2580 synthase
MLPDRLPAREFLIDERHAGQRIDNFLSTCLKGLPRARIYRILRRGEVRVNKGRIRQHYRLRAGDVVRVPPVRLAEPATPRPVPEGLRERIEDTVLYEHAGLLVLDKPAGMAVHGGSGVSHGVIETLRAARPGARMLELVHRLDRETSGCLMIASRRAVLTGLHDALRAGEVDKRYVALLVGRWKGGARRVDLPLEKNQLRSGERVVRADAGGKRSITLLEPLAVGERFTLVRARPLTGRTHQIRVHAAAIGMPIAGDAKYGDRARDAAVRALGLGRLFLHASSLRLRHPADGIRVRVDAPLPGSLGALLVELGLGRNAPSSSMAGVAR